MKYPEEGALYADKQNAHVLWKAMQKDFEIIDEIRPTESGKLRFVISKVADSLA